MRLDLRSFALASGLFWGFCVFAGTIWIVMFDGASTDPTFIGSFYRGYTVSVVGSLIGAGYGLVDGVICGAIFAWLYNMLVGKIGRKTEETALVGA